MSSPSQAAVLVYDRISANRRRTRFLLVIFAILLLPVALFGSEYLAMWAMMLTGGAVGSMEVALTTGFLLLVFIVWLEYRYAAHLVLRMVRAHPLPAEEEPALRRAVENLCIGCGLPQPTIYLVETEATNAFSVGLDPERISLVLTRGLLARLDTRELEGVIAHELSHIGNRDTRLGTVLAALVATLWLPAAIVKTLFRGLFRVHPIFWLCGLLWSGTMIAFGVEGWASLIPDVITKKEWFWLWLMAFSAYVVAGSPFVAIFLRRWIWRQREFLADADAVLLTRLPSALHAALQKASASAASVQVNPSTAHLWIADPLVASPSVMDRLFSAHPPMRERLQLLAGMAGPMASPTPVPAASSGAQARPRRWSNKTLVALILLFFPSACYLWGGFNLLMSIYGQTQLLIFVALAVAVYRWRYSKQFLTNFLEPASVGSTEASSHFSVETAGISAKASPDRPEETSDGRTS